METQDIWENHNSELYFFILKKVRNKNTTNDILQNTFLKIHKNLGQLKDEEKTRAWIFQIARNEIANYLTKAYRYGTEFDMNEETTPPEYENVCCFDKFINELPTHYREVIELVYMQGKKQKEAAKDLGIRLENVKIRIRRAKEILKHNLKVCCKYEFDGNGHLKGEPDCAVCHS